MTAAPGTPRMTFANLRIWPATSFGVSDLACRQARSENTRESARVNARAADRSLCFIAFLFVISDTRQDIVLCAGRRPRQRRLPEPGAAGSERDALPRRGRIAPSCHPLGAADPSPVVGRGGSSALTAAASQYVRP